MAKAKLPSLKKARETARGGDVEQALPALLHYAAAGDASAAASAAQVLAYLGRWDELIPLAGAFIANPFSTYAGNVFDDCVRLLGRAAIETGAWARVAAVAREARAEVEAALDRNAQNFARPKVDAVRTRLTKILVHFAAAADRGDVAGVVEPIRIFGVAHASGSREDFETAAAMRVNAAPERRLALAIAYGIDDELLRAYAQLAKPPMFEQALCVAKAMLRAGAAEEAARALETNWPCWYPCDAAYVAPVEPLTDPALLPLLSAAQREALVRTPRAGAVLSA